MRASRPNERPVLSRTDPAAAASALPPLSRALADVDRVFGVAPVLAAAARPPRDQVARYYLASERGYRRVHSAEGSMHLALSPAGRFDPEDYRAQARQVAELARQRGATSVLELGSGQGFNALHLARALPGARVQGLDLMAHHVAQARARAAGLDNLSFRQGSFEPLALPAPVDLILGVEALCYARDVPGLARALAAALNPGGALVIFDAFRTRPLAAMTPQMAQAVQLYEGVTAVTDGFRPLADWSAALQAAGLSVTAEDLTAQTLPGVRRLHAYGQRYFNDWKIRLATRLFPRILRHNAIGALLGPYLVEGPNPGTPNHETPNPENPALTYQRLVATKAD